MIEKIKQLYYLLEVHLKYKDKKSDYKRIWEDVSWGYIQKGSGYYINMTY